MFGGIRHRLLVHRAPCHTMSVFPPPGTASSVPLHSPFHCIVYLRATRTQISLSKAPVDRREELSPLPSIYLDGCIYNDHCSLAGDVVSDGERPSTPTARSSTQACAKARRELTATSDLSTREPSVTACMRPCAITPRTRNCHGSIGNEKAKRTQ